MKRFAAFQAPPPSGSSPHTPRRRAGGHLTGEGELCEGQLYRLPPAAEVDILWLVLYHAADSGPKNPFYLAICDRLVGFLAEAAHDTLVPPNDPNSPLVVRPMMGAWVKEEFLASKVAAGVVLEATLELAQDACAMAVQQDPGAPIGRVMPDLESYREYVIALVAHLRRCADYNA